MWATSGLSRHIASLDDILGDDSGICRLQFLQAILLPRDCRRLLPAALLLDKVVDWADFCLTSFEISVGLIYVGIILQGRNEERMSHLDL